ncbi:hypothetical protein MANES_02G017467v8 [Manihot esculenta]|uniref:Uncharacterized protein n=1 Tax=Manihot esculenta TaxID=3983 RepID=A0ACB7I3R9_MANES|nr:hypothetical protein MANES_02G017467v8 [Manihot esculenta]
MFQAFLASIVGGLQCRSFDDWFSKRDELLKVSSGSKLYVGFILHCVICFLLCVLSCRRRKVHVRRQRHQLGWPCCKPLIKGLSSFSIF